MDEEKIDKAIERGDLEMRGSHKLAPTLCWSATAFFALVGLTAPHWGILLAGLMGVASFYSALAARQALQKYENNRARHLWEHLGGVNAFGQPHSLYTEVIGNQIKRIYEVDPSGLLLPIRQTVRLLTAYHLQQRKLKNVTAQLEKIQGITDRIQRLGQGDDQTLVSESTQINANLRLLKRERAQILDSCARLELILTKIEHTLEARQLHREISELTLGLPPTNEPSFAAESLEDIERQIGREIETYLQLERETDEHLR